MDVSFELLGAVDVGNMRAEVRLFPAVPAEEHTWAAPAHILSYRLTPGTELWTRCIAKRSTGYVPQGPLAFRPRAAVWECKSNGRPTLTVMSFFKDDSLPPPKEAEREPLTLEDLPMMEMMRLLHDEIRAPGFASTAMVESIAEMLRIKLTRLAGAREAPAGGAAFGPGEIALIHDYIEAQKGRSPSVAELAKLCNMSRRSLLRRFRSGTGMTVAGYIAQTQLAKAKSLLANSSLGLKQIAYETGFATPSNFTLAFKRASGMTPSAFRSLARGG